MPSRYPEPYGLVIAEAMWSGLPVIASQSALLAGDIVNCGAGLVCDPADESAFAEAISRIDKDDGATRAMSLAAYCATRHIGLSPDAWADRFDACAAAMEPGVVMLTHRATAMAVRPAKFCMMSPLNDC